MKPNWMNLLGDWNPQLLREFKGRLKTRNLILSTAISLLGQFVVFMYFQTQLPTKTNLLYNYSHRYCTGKSLYDAKKCLGDEFGNVIINWQLWSLDAFTLLSIIGCFTLLVAGTYLLISDLANEERHDTLNFIRLSPQSPHSILWGKMLGVPILLYAAVLVAVPLHLWLGLVANIPLMMILSFYAIAIAASLFYYSGALLFGLVGSWLGSFQAWLGSSAVLGFLMFTKQAIVPDVSANTPFVVLRLMNPYYLIPHPEVSSIFAPNNPNFINFHWFGIPLGSVFFITVCFAILVYFIGAYFIWQSLQRCFRDPNATMLSKKQSYLLTTCFTVITLGCANWQKLNVGSYYSSHTIFENLACLLFLNLWLFLYLIAALNPHRQILQDWARYRHIYNYKAGHRSNLIRDLIWGEKSPGTLAIAINAMIAITCLSVFILISGINTGNEIKAFTSLFFCGSLAVIYAVIAQLLLLMKNQHRLFWATGAVGAAIVLPVIILAMLFSNPGNNSFLWLFSVAAPLIALYPSGEYTSTMAPFLAILGHCGILGLLVFQLTRKLRKVGESATKALLVEN
ncbi:hypothetical protein I8751_22665 [Nostocaceae cyanobacterium CENA357]|uniref:Uncharacterized protein n=1 Tax=Atlanticothrix silvestris CENA357 TaxID=1725252 RepID=A0A8J7HMN5_9CYAN|nr:hypothetical protein [Atlanticothrix silvestris]MBH8555100.1 hypothetical protein [Atlanticothrix silvestris CENA357]